MTIFRHKGLIAVLAGVALIVGGFAVASNMGFKFVPDIAAGDAFNLSLPWNNNYTTAESLRSDLGADQVTQIDSASNFISWLGSTGVNFDVVSKEAYLVFAPSGNGIQPVVVGSHDPNAAIDFAAGEFQNLSAPYHQTLTTAQELFDDIENQVGAGTVEQVTKIDAQTNFISWLGTTGVNFNLDLGMGVLVKAASTAGGYQWPHY
jgi:hypothetical protein